MYRSLVRYAGLIAAASSLLAAGCGVDHVTAPAPPAPSASLLGSLLGTVTSVLQIPTATIGYAPIATRTIPLPVDVVVSQTIGSAGGRMVVPQTGLTVTFAPGAVSVPTAISITAHAGRYVEYDFQPHGLIFKAPVVLTQSVGGTSAAGLSSPVGTYLANGQADIGSNGVAAVAEFLPTKLVSGVLDTLLGALLQPDAVFPIWHFSGYALATGRSAY